MTKTLVLIRHKGSQIRLLEVRKPLTMPLLPGDTDSFYSFSCRNIVLFGWQDPILLYFRVSNQTGEASRLR